MTPEGGLKIKRILVALDASPSSMAALEAAVELAAAHGAKIVGLFVEDLNLVRMAQLPFAREVLQYNARVRKLGLAEMERQLQAQAARARRALAHKATEQDVPWSFRVSRGDIPLEVLAEAEESDFIVLGKSGWSEARRMGSTSRVVVSKAPGHVLIIERGVRIRRPVMTVYDGSELAQRALEAAAALAEREDLGLTVILLAGDEEAAQELQNEAAEWLRGRSLAARFNWLRSAEARELKKAVESAGCLLVIPGSASLPRGEPVAKLIDKLQCPVLVVR